MDFEQKLKHQEHFIRENGYWKVCGINLYCMQYNIYRNGTNFLRQFICYIKGP